MAKLLNFPLNVIPGQFQMALSKADEARKLVGYDDKTPTTREMQQAIRALCEANELLVHVLTDNAFTQ